MFSSTAKKIKLSKVVPATHFLSQPPTAEEIQTLCDLEGPVPTEDLRLTTRFFQYIKANNVSAVRQLLAYGIEPEVMLADQATSPLETAIQAEATETGACLLAWGAEVNPIPSNGTVQSTPLAQCLAKGGTHPLVLPLLSCGARLTLEETMQLSKLTEGPPLLFVVLTPESPEEAETRYLLLLSRILWLKKVEELKQYSQELPHRRIKTGVDLKQHDLMSAITRIRCLIAHQLLESTSPDLLTPIQLYECSVNNQESLEQVRTRKRWGPTLRRRRQDSLTASPQLVARINHASPLCKRHSLANPPPLALDSPLCRPRRVSSPNLPVRKISRVTSDEWSDDEEDPTPSITMQLSDLLSKLAQLTTIVYSRFDAYGDGSPIHQHWYKEVEPSFRAKLIAQITTDFTHQARSSEPEEQALRRKLEALRERRAAHTALVAGFADEVEYAPLKAQYDAAERTLVFMIQAVQRQLGDLANVQIRRMQADTQQSFRLSELLRVNCGAEGGQGSRSPLGKLAVAMVSSFQQALREKGVGKTQEEEAFKTLLEFNSQLQATIQKLQILMHLAEIVLIASSDIKPDLLAKVDTYLRERRLIREETQADEILEKKAQIHDLLADLKERLPSLPPLGTHQSAFNSLVAEIGAIHSAITPILAPEGSAISARVTLKQ